jgi:hypothetical protein
MTDHPIRLIAVGDPSAVSCDGDFCVIPPTGGESAPADADQEAQPPLSTIDVAGASLMTVDVTFSDESAYRARSDPPMTG